MSWFKQVADHILNNLEDYAKEFLNPTAVEKSGKNLFINPCPFCGHDDCFGLTKGFFGGNCLSCKASGNLVNIVEQLMGDEIKAGQALSEWAGIKYNFASQNPQEAGAKEKHARYQRLLKEAIDVYHRALTQMKYTYQLKNGQEVDPLNYQLNVRKHTVETLENYQVGFSFPGLYKGLIAHLMSKGFTEEEVQVAEEMIKIPDGYFVYPYFNERGNLIRVNGKPFVRKCRGNKTENGYAYDCDFCTFAKDKEAIKSHEAEHGHKVGDRGFSTGNKDEAFFYNRKNMKSKRFLLLVEGEDDTESADEALDHLPPHYKKEFLVAGIGGSPPAGMFESDFLRKFEAVYEAFDNDSGGDTFREQLDREMPEVGLKHIDHPFKDLDEFLKLGPDNALEEFQDMLDQAVTVFPKHYRLDREGKKHEWYIRNRHYGLKYQVDGYQPKRNLFAGTLIYYSQGVRVTKKSGDIDNITFPGFNNETLKLRTALSDTLEEYYHNVRWLYGEPERTYEELVDMYRYTKYKRDVIKALAWYLYHSTEQQKLQKISLFTKVVRDEKQKAILLQELSVFESQDIDRDQYYPPIHLSQSLFPKNNDAFMYFSQVVQDGEDMKRVPCLLSNKKEIIRLDILKRKEAQSMLLIKKRYELPEEVEIALVDSKNLSLQYAWVKRWINDELTQGQIEPATIIAEIEAFIQMTYYAKPDVVKVLALWIYATYYYKLFTSGFPYLMINGSKGTGKSTMDLIVYLLAFNPTFTVNTSEAALYRRIDFIGGTFILDELENLTDSKKVDDSGIAAVLKAGYSEAGEIMRVDPDTKHAKGFSAFGPKVISNIRGLEDVIADRCIRIDTQVAPEELLKKLKNPFDFKVEKRDYIYSITSRAAISALTHFQEADRLFQENTRINTGNARLTQLLRPLVAIARLVGGDYEEHLMQYYRTSIKDAKKEVHETTLDGMLEMILTEISEEFLGHKKEKTWTVSGHMYDKPIQYDRENGVFEINAMHLKVYAQELNTDKIHSYVDVHAAMKTLLAKKNFDPKKNRRTSKVTVTDENLLKQLNGTRQPNVQFYTLNVRDFVPKHVENVKYKEEEPTEPLF